MPKASSSTRDHAVVIPLFGALPSGLPEQLQGFVAGGFHVVLVDNRSPTDRHRQPVTGLAATATVVANHNQGGVAGGFNRGIEQAIREGAQIVTLLDQDSGLPWDALLTLATALMQAGNGVVVGPRVVDQWRHGVGRAAQRPQPADDRERPMLISAGTTFRSCDWRQLGAMHEAMEIDYVDHYWCYRAQHRGFRFREIAGVVLRQRFGERHPNAICRWLGMQLYSPARHYTSLRNLRWMLKQACVPLDFKLKEAIKMTAKPWLWLLLEPGRGANLEALKRGLLDPLPGDDPSR